MIPRDFRPTGAALAANIDAYINGPNGFECLLYRADLSHPETVASVADVVGSMESSERAVTYHDPIPARAAQIVEGPFFQEITNSGEEADGNREQPIILIMNVEPVPEQSVIQYEEMTGEGEERRLVSLYVIKSDGVGAAPGAKKRHYCVPFPRFDGTP